MKNYLTARLHEASTWRGIVLLLTAAGVGISPEQGEAIIAGGLAFAGLLAAFLPDSK